MNKYRISLFILGIVGLLISAYLLEAYVLGGPIKCYGGHGCDIVRNSVYSSFFGLPTPAYGVIFYALLLGAALVMREGGSRLYQRALLLLTLGGFLVSLYLTYLEAFVIHAWCWWCVTSAITATLAFLVVSLYTITRSV